MDQEKKRDLSLTSECKTEKSEFSTWQQESVLYLRCTDRESSPLPS